MKIKDIQFKAIYWAGVKFVRKGTILRKPGEISCSYFSEKVRDVIGENVWEKIDGNKDYNNIIVYAHVWEKNKRINNLNKLKILKIID